MPSSIDSHPQRQKIIDSILAGKSLRDISASVTPHVSHTAIQRYRAKVVAPAMANSATLTKVLHGQGINPVETLTAPDVTAVTRLALDSAPVLAVRERRLAALQERHERLLTIIAERSAAMADVPGGRSGLLQEIVKQCGSDFRVDATLLSELREHEKQAAIELGQWQEGSGSAGVTINIACPVQSATITPASPGPDDATVIDIGLK